MAERAEGRGESSEGRDGARLTATDKKLKELADELLRVDSKCDGMVRVEPDHFGSTHWKCVDRREQIENQIVYWRNRAVPA